MNKQTKSLTITLIPMMRHCQRDDIVLTCEADITHGLLQLFLPPGYRYIGLIFLLLRLSLNNTPDCSPVIISMLCHVMSCHVMSCHSHIAISMCDCTVRFARRSGTIRLRH